jgi:hypothetical protein
MKRENKTKFSKTYFFNQLEGGLTMKSLVVFLGVILLIASVAQAREETGYVILHIYYDAPIGEVTGVASVYSYPDGKVPIVVRELQEAGNVCHLGSFPLNTSYVVVVEVPGFALAIKQIRITGEEVYPKIYMEEAEISGTVSAQGGKVETEEATIEVPAGVSNNGMEISVEKIEEGNLLPEDSVSCVRLESSVENFAKPVKVTLSYPAGTSNVSVVTRESLSDVWTNIGGIVGSNNTITVEVTHFSYFAVVTGPVSLQESTWGSVKEMFK